MAGRTLRLEEKQKNKLLADKWHRQIESEDKAWLEENKLTFEAVAKEESLADEEKRQRLQLKKGRLRLLLRKEKLSVKEKSKLEIEAKSYLASKWWGYSRIC